MGGKPGRPNGPPQASGQSTGTNDLRAFRQRLHDCFVRRADALFEICDAVLAASNAPSPAHPSLEAVHRRGWGSLYAALSKGGVVDAPIEARAPAALRIRQYVRDALVRLGERLRERLQGTKHRYLAYQGLSLGSCKEGDGNPSPEKLA